MLNGIMHCMKWGILAVALLASPALASQRPVELEGIVKASHPYGQGRLSRFLFHVYDAELWTDATRWGYETSFALNVRYTMSFSSAELTRSTLDEMQRIKSFSGGDAARFRGYLDRAYRDVASGDRICAVYSPPNVTTFYVNAKETARVQDAPFTHAFFGIWLSESTSEPELRTALLGLRQ